MSIKWKASAQTASLFTSVIAATILLAPLGMTPGLPEKIAACIFAIGAIVDFVLLIMRTPATNVMAKWVGALMMFSFLLNVIAMSILWFPVLASITVAIQIAAVIAVIDVIAESIELILMK